MTVGLVISRPADCLLQNSQRILLSTVVHIAQHPSTVHIIQKDQIDSVLFKKYIRYVHVVVKAHKGQVTQIMESVPLRTYRLMDWKG